MISLWAAVTDFVLVHFLLENITIDCVVIGGRRYSSDLPQRGLEIPCKLIFNGKLDDIKKLSKTSSGSNFVVKKFMHLNFVTNEVLRKFFNTKIFPIYSILIR